MKKTKKEGTFFVKKNRFFPLLTGVGTFLIVWIIPLLFGMMGASFQTDTSPIKTAPTRAENQTEITLLHQGVPVVLPLEEYLYGVVAGEMPASFESEALKAQAVAARTYTINRAKSPGKDHPEADVCSDPSHCKAYLTPDELSQKFSEHPEHFEKIKHAVDSTKHQILIYNGEPISAVFHSTSSGMTENAEDVWGNPVPYLVSVESEGEEASPRYQETKSFTMQEFQDKIHTGTKKVSFMDNQKNWFSNWVRNESGSVKSVSLCGTEFSGVELRSLLGLRSANFTVEITDCVNITTKGNGHGVGMSQYGANHLAKMGYTYDQILKKYYTGVEITNG